MKKNYVAPKTQVVNSCLCNIMTGSDTTVYEYYCPYTEAQCKLYDGFVVRRIGVNKGFLKETKFGTLFMAANVPCPYRQNCEHYNLFCDIMNVKQR